jgi:inosine/xanthosine triphosphate pyrophosphatase family protein
MTPCLCRTGFGETFAELAAENQEPISHRGQALQSQAPFEELIDK